MIVVNKENTEIVNLSLVYSVSKSDSRFNFGPGGWTTEKCSGIKFSVAAAAQDESLSTKFWYETEAERNLEFERIKTQL